MGCRRLTVVVVPSQVILRMDVNLHKKLMLRLIYLATSSVVSQREIWILAEIKITRSKEDELTASPKKNEDNISQEGKTHLIA